MTTLTIDYLSIEKAQVFFSSEYSSFRASFQVDENKDVWMDGAIEHEYNRIDVTVYNNAVVYVTDDIVLDVKLTDDICREVAKLIEKEI